MKKKLNSARKLTQSYYLTDLNMDFLYQAVDALEAVRNRSVSLTSIAKMFDAAAMELRTYRFDLSRAPSTALKPFQGIRLKAGKTKIAATASELEFAENAIAFMAYTTRNGLRFPEILGTLSDDFGVIAFEGGLEKALSKGYQPKVAFMSLEEMVGIPSEEMQEA